MEDALNRYYKRQKTVQKKHARMAKGYVTKLNKNGVFEQVPDNKVGGASVRIVIWAAMIFMAFKAVTLWWLGADVYAGHVRTLEAGTPFEQVGGWLMQIDPVTAAGANALSLLNI